MLDVNNSINESDIVAINSKKAGLINFYLGLKGSTSKLISLVKGEYAKTKGGNETNLTTKEELATVTLLSNILLSLIDSDLQAELNNVGFKIPLNSDWFSKNKDICPNYSLRPFRKAVQMLEDIRLIKLHKGYQSERRSTLTLVSVTPFKRDLSKLLNHLKKFKVKERKRSVLSVKLSDTKPNSKKFKSIKNQMTNLNNHISKVTIGTEDGLSIPLSVYRTFADHTLTHSGYIICQNIRNLPKSVRKKLLVEQEVSTEVDFSFFIPSLLYAQKNKSIPLKPYDIKGGFAKKQVKKSLHIIMNTPDSSKALNNIATIVFKNDRKKAQEIFEALKTKHKVIWDSINTKSSELMAKGSNLMQEICNSLCMENIPFVPIIDCILTSRKYQNEVIKVMETESLCLIGQKLKVRIEY